MLVDASAIRVQCAARLIAYYCSKGKQCFFIKPLWDSPIFACYWGICLKPRTIYDQWLLEQVTTHWEGDPANCIPYPVLMLFRKHTEAEQLAIARTLEKHYDFRTY